MKTVFQRNIAIAVGSTMKIHNLILGTFLLLIIAGSIDAASFDCGKATSEVEKLICSDVLLSKSDDDLAALYAKTLKQAADPASVKKRQREWFSTVHNSCTNAECLREAYATRISELLLVKKLKSACGPKAIISDAEACQLVVEHANRGILDKLREPSTAMPEMENIERIFGESPFLDNLSYWRLDLNNDGIPDHLGISVQGTAHVSYGYVLSGKKGSAVQEVSDDGYYDLSVLNVSGRYYVLSHYQDRPGKLWGLDKDGNLLPVCQFKPRKEPEVELVAGKESAVCLEAQQGRIHHVTYPLLHALEPMPRESGILSPIDGLAQVDIDNDGTPDNVVRVDFLRVGGRGCSGIYVAVTDAARTNIPDTKLNELLSGKAQCDWNMFVFVHDGIAYVDAHGDAGDRSIYRIKGDKGETICEFSGRLIYDVVDVVKESEE